MIVIGYDASQHARAAIKQAGILMPGHPALVLTVWGPPAHQDLAESDVVMTEAQARAEAMAADGALLGHQLGIDCQPRTLRHCTTIAEAIVAEARPIAEAIVAEARRVEARAIIVGRGEDAEGAPLGPVARAVVRDAHCAVLVAATGVEGQLWSTERLGLGEAA
jgi:nucleotide-binding universal stress UspA family protein